MHIAIIHNDQDVYVEFDPDKFRKLFKQYFRKYKNVDVVFERIIQDIKKAALTK